MDPTSDISPTRTLSSCGTRRGSSSAGTPTPVTESRGRACRGRSRSETRRASSVARCSVDARPGSVSGPHRAELEDGEGLAYRAEPLAAGRAQAPSSRDGSRSRSSASRARRRRASRGDHVVEAALQDADERERCAGGRPTNGKALEDVDPAFGPTISKSRGTTSIWTSSLRSVRMVSRSSSCEASEKAMITRSMSSRSTTPSSRVGGPDERDDARARAGVPRMSSPRSRRD